jgi:hypothetical protein
MILEMETQQAFMLLAFATWKRGVFGRTKQRRRTLEMSPSEPTKSTGKPINKGRFYELLV